MKPQRGKNSKKKGEVDPVEVYCRIRPLDNPNDTCCVKPLNTTVVQLIPPENSLTVARNGQIKEYQFTFQYVFDEYTSQKAVFDYVACPLVDDLIKGKNGLLFTYGITSSGKTYTMTGTPKDQGILPRCLDVLFNSISGVQAKKYVFKSDKMNGFEVQSEADAMIERQKRDIMPGITTPKTPTSNRRGNFGDQERISDPTILTSVDDDNQYAVFVSYIEIYNNYVYDLLEELPYDPITGYKPPQTKILRTDSSDCMYVMNCVEVEITSPEEAFEVLFKGQKRRKVAHTALNAESSRSHSIFNIRLVQGPLDPRGEEVLQDPDKICVSQLSLVDLAGSERTHRTKNAGDRLKEAGNINQSLMALRNCIEILRENQKNNSNKMVPYRDSKLTHLFKNYFDGEGKVRMVVCVNPKGDEFDETIHVMKFAELSQEVLIARQQQVRFDIGLTPGRRKINQNYKDKFKPEEDLCTPAKLPAFDFTLGPGFPPFELLRSTDNIILAELEKFLEERQRRRKVLQLELDKQNDEFRAHLVEFERNYDQAMIQNEDLQQRVEKSESYVQKLESRIRSLERRLGENTRQTKESERQKRELEAMIQDKEVKIRQEKSEKERLKNDFKARLDMNNQHWERNLEKERQKIEQDYGGQIWERQQKLNMLRNIVNETDSDASTPMPAPRETFRTPAPKSRTQTTPAKMLSARSENDMRKIGTTPTPRARTVTTGATLSAARANLRPTTKSTSKTPKPTPPFNPRHRRSRSSNAEIWLDHRPPGSVELDTVLQPKMKKKKSVSKLEVKDTKEVSKYMLTHQDMDSEDNLTTQIYKGDCLPTAGGGTAVVFNDVETLKQTSPGSRKRRSSCPQPQDYEGDWTDVEDRCNIAIEGHGNAMKRSKPNGATRV
ncbi:kinesin-like protein KIF23 isoform X2 [Saccostrea echinata]|uniref:kinesin-like protein KIF23 isoform X2 n=1 Tax=Saccostrea echinata TaxID=191078 RepID=UPI002A82E816|nr:kinesin-like protein KIF23 isoform X2 [Saccostrea echinata]